MLFGHVFRHRDFRAAIGIQGYHVNITKFPIFRPERVGVGQTIGTAKLHLAYNCPHIEVDNISPVCHGDAASLWNPDSTGRVRGILGSNYN
jgi:hypothetical protein